MGPWQYWIPLDWTSFSKKMMWLKQLLTAITAYFVSLLILLPRQWRICLWEKVYSVFILLIGVSNDSLELCTLVKHYLKSAFLDIDKIKKIFEQRLANYWPLITMSRVDQAKFCWIQFSYLRLFSHSILLVWIVRDIGMIYDCVSSSLPKFWQKPQMM